MCNVGHLNYLFDAEENTLNIHIFDYQHPRRRLERHQMLDAPNITVSIEIYIKYIFYSSNIILIYLIRTLNVLKLAPLIM